MLLSCVVQGRNFLPALQSNGYTKPSVNFERNRKCLCSVIAVAVLYLFST